MQFLIDPNDSLLLLALYRGGTIKRAAHLLERDETVILRRIQKLSQTSDLLEKVSGKWRVSPSGQKVALWAQEAQDSQRRALESRATLRIGAPASFIERIITPDLEKPLFRALAAEYSLEFLCPAIGLETALLKGDLDLVFTCHRPFDPQIRFKRLAHEDWCVVAAPSIAKSILGKATRQESISRLLTLPYVRHRDLVPEEMLGLAKDSVNTRFTFDLLASVRSAAVHGFGWTLLPRGSIDEELKNGKLVELGTDLQLKLKRDFLGVWWRKDRQEVSRFSALIGAWLSKHRSLV